jgi:hypothetical protein
MLDEYIPEDIQDEIFLYNIAAEEVECKKRSDDALKKLKPVMDNEIPWDSKLKGQFMWLDEDARNMIIDLIADSYINVDDRGDEWQTAFIDEMQSSIYNESEIDDIIDLKVLDHAVKNGEVLCEEEQERYNNYIVDKI